MGMGGLDSEVSLVMVGCGDPGQVDSAEFLPDFFIVWVPVGQRMDNKRVI